MVAVWCIICLLIFVFAMVGLAHSLTGKGKAYAKRNSELNNQISNSAKDFRVSKTFYLADNFTFAKPDSEKKMIAVDSENEKVLFIDYAKGTMFIVKFEEILNYEIYENGSQSTSGIGVGGFVGFFGAETTGVCTDLKLIIRINKVENSQIVYDIVSDTSLNAGISKASHVYKECIKSLQEVVSFLEVIKNKNQHK